MAEPSQVGEARRFALQFCADLAFDEVRRGRVGIVVNELGNNLVKYAPGGSLLMRPFTAKGGTGFEILSVDKGPGIANAERAMSDGFTTGSTPGTGLGAVRRQSDVFDLFSETGKGTVIVSRIFAQDENAGDDDYTVGVVNFPLAGENVCGDGYATAIDGERFSAIVVDGLGHGLQANKAAQEAVQVFENRGEKNLEQLLAAVHGRLKSTRGGAVFLLETTPAGDLSFTGVGNIRAVVQTGMGFKTMISQNGTAGVQMRTAKILSQPWRGEGLVILHSDGLASRWDLALTPGLLHRHPAVVAGVLFRDYSRGTDDATVLVVGKNK